MTAYVLQLRIDIDEEYLSDLNIKPSKAMVKDFVTYANRYLNNADDDDIKELLISTIVLFEKLEVLSLKEFRT